MNEPSGYFRYSKQFGNSILLHLFILSWFIFLMISPLLGAKGNIWHIEIASLFGFLLLGFLILNMHLMRSNVVIDANGISWDFRGKKIWKTIKWEDLHDIEIYKLALYYYPILKRSYRFRLSAKTVFFAKKNGPIIVDNLIENFDELRGMINFYIAKYHIPVRDFADDTEGRSVSRI